MARKQPERNTSRQASAEVLREAGEPSKSAGVARRAARGRRRQAGGKIPAATVAAILAVEKKPDGLFVRVAPGDVCTP